VCNALRKPLQQCVGQVVPHAGNEVGFCAGNVLCQMLAAGQGHQRVGHAVHDARGCGDALEQGRAVAVGHNGQQLARRTRRVPGALHGFEGTGPQGLEIGRVARAADGAQHVHDPVHRCVGARAPGA
jgi:hypothetical protein